MTVSTIHQILGRINAAPAKSPIAVFDVGRSGHADAMFAATAYVARQRGNPDLIGVFHKDNNPVSVELAIRRRINAYSKD